jgi:hypothetical protein
MARKTIAIALLFLVAAWAEFPLASMLMMRAGHVRSAQELTQSMAAHYHATPIHHPCCPSIRPAIALPAIEFASAGLPCGGQHRCCFRSAPASTPAPVREDRKPARNISLLQASAQATPLQQRPPLNLVAPIALSPQLTFSMILRI